MLKRPTRHHPNEKKKSEEGVHRIGVIEFLEKKTTITSGDESYFVFEKYRSGYIHGDTVEFQIIRPPKEGKLPEAKPIRLIRRSKEPLLFEVRKDRSGLNFQLLEIFGYTKYTFIKGIPKDISIGDIYMGIFRDQRTVEIQKLFAKKGDPEGEETIILFRHGIRESWADGIEKNIKKISIPTGRNSTTEEPSYLKNHTKIYENDLFQKIEVDGRERIDFRGWMTLTIDGADAKDLDDAISISIYENGDFLLGVHIADVAEYVDALSPLDSEAYMRGTSVYTPGRVIPMLPEGLSNDRCSLHPGEPKLTLSILMRIDPSGKVKESWVTEGVIESVKKGVYDDIWEELQPFEKGNNFDSIDTKGGGKNLNNFYSLYKILEERRKKEGKITFETTECYFDVDEKRRVKNIKKRERNDAHMMIEEFMVLANEEIAKWCVKRSLPFLSRIHSLPGEEQRQVIAAILEAEHLREKLEPHHIRDHLEKFSDPKERYRLSRLLLPKMAKAYYHDTPSRHFGLALSYYAHFTSPIRRYPDLLLHRMIKLSLHGYLTRETINFYKKEMKKWGKSLSEKERRAEEAERSIDALMMCRYMSDKVGQSYDGMISGLTESNIYVELPNGIEGSIYLGRSPSKLILDPVKGAFVDTKGRIISQIGQTIQVKVREVDMKNRRIEFDLYNS